MLMQKHRPDHESDPAHTPGDGWVSEGGASHLGPATHLRILPEDQADETREHPEGDDRES